MIQIAIYENGFEIFGHADIATCTGISSMARLIGNCIYIEDTKSWGTNDNGYTAYIFNEENLKAKELLKAFIETVEESFDNVFDRADVMIHKFSGNINKKECIKRTL